jgi:SAM-dependent methyltransferase
MSHPEWSSVYGKMLDMVEFIDHVYSHKPYLAEIYSHHPKEILEVGVGGGSTSIFLTYMGIEVHAIDKDPKVVENARLNNAALKGGLIIKEADAFNLPYPDKHFDVVCHHGFFEHFTDDEIKQLLKEQLRVGRKVIFSVPTRYYLSNSLGERLMTRRKWERILSPYRIEKSTYYGRPRNDSPLKRILAALGWKNIYYYAVVS